MLVDAAAGYAGSGAEHGKQRRFKNVAIGRKSSCFSSPLPATMRIPARGDRSLPWSKLKEDA